MAEAVAERRRERRASSRVRVLVVVGVLGAAALGLSDLPAAFLDVESYDLPPRRGGTRIGG